MSLPSSPRAPRPGSSCFSEDPFHRAAEIISRIRDLDSNKPPQWGSETQTLWSEFHRLLDPVARTKARVIKQRSSRLRSSTLTIDEIASFLHVEIWKAALSFDALRGSLRKHLLFEPSKRVWDYIRDQCQDVKGPSRKSKDGRSGAVMIDVVSRDAAPRSEFGGEHDSDSLTEAESRLLEHGANEELLERKIDLDRLRASLTEWLAELPPEERQVIQDLYLDGKSKRSLVESGSARAALRETQERALAHLRALMGV